MDVTVTPCEVATHRFEYVLPSAPQTGRYSYVQTIDDDSVGLELCVGGGVPTVTVAVAVGASETIDVTTGAAEGAIVGLVVLRAGMAVEEGPTVEANARAGCSRE